MYAAIQGVAHGDSLGILADVADAQHAADAQSQTALALVTSLAFLVPAVTALRMKRSWHGCVFVLLAAACASFHCAGAPGREPHSEAAARWLAHGYQVWLYFCFLQMAFLVVGPEDPQLQALGQGTGTSLAKTQGHAPAPWDVVVAARVAPLAALSLLHVGEELAGGDVAAPWRSMLLTELLLVLCTAAFWAHRSRRNYAPCILLRFKFWHRLIHHGVIPAMMLFWTFCITGLTDRKAAYAVWHMVVAAFATSILRTVLPDAGGPAEEVFDPSWRNPSVAHILLGVGAALVLPAVAVGISYDWCSGGEWRWPTVATATACEPGSYFVAIMAVPAFSGASAVFWLISAVSRGKMPWSHLGGPGESPELSLGLRQRRLGTDLGCVLGQAGAASGLSGFLAVLLLRGSPLQELAHLFLSLLSLGLLLVGMVLTVLSSDPLGQGFLLRRTLTLYGCLPIAAIHAMLSLLVTCFPQISAPQSAYAASEYLVAVALALWPLTWAAEVQEQSQRKPSMEFTWPVTAWRFQ